MDWFTRCFQVWCVGLKSFRVLWYIYTYIKPYFPCEVQMIIQTNKKSLFVLSFHWKLKYQPLKDRNISGQLSLQLVHSSSSVISSSTENMASQGLRRASTSWSTASLVISLIVQRSSEPEASSRKLSLNSSGWLMTLSCAIKWMINETENSQLYWLSINTLFST